MKVEVSNYIATVVMDRPPVNAMNKQMFDEIQAAFDALNNRDEVRAAVFTGVVAPLSVLRPLLGENRENHNQDNEKSVRQMQKPTQHGRSLQRLTWKAS